MPDLEYRIEEDEKDKRLDVYLAQKLVQHYSRSQIQKWIALEGVRVNGHCVAAHYRLKAGDKIVVGEMGEPEDEGTRGEDIPVEILYEDDDVIMVNKPAGMVVHPAHGNLHHTLVNALLFHTRDLAQVGDPVRPGIVHRLDKDTSGVLVIAKNTKAHAFLAKQFKHHTIERVYRVVVQGIVQHDEGVCEEPVGRAFLNRKKVIVKPSGGKDAVTYFKVLRRFKNASLLEVRPRTGRTHQIRVHMAHLNHPVLGDLLYGVSSPWIGRQALHAFSLAFTHPRTRERIYRESALPEDIAALITHLESSK